MIRTASGAGLATTAGVLSSLLNDKNLTNSAIRQDGRRYAAQERNQTVPRVVACNRSAIIAGFIAHWVVLQARIATLYFSFNVVLEIWLIHNQEGRLRRLEEKVGSMAQRSWYHITVHYGPPEYEH